jgi:hypothetical protein
MSCEPFETTRYRQPDDRQLYHIPSYPSFLAIEISLIEEYML